MKFIQARNYRPGPRGVPIELLVIHDMEYPEDKPTAAEDCARYFANTTRDASTHYCFDTDSEVQCVKEEDIAYGCKHANRNGIHYELAGYAKQTRRDWTDPNSLKILRRCAKQAAADAKQYGIPLRKAKFAGPGDPRVVEKGFCGHADVPLHGTHYDPGKEFPWDVFLKLVHEAMYPAAPAPPPATLPAWYKRILERGSRGDDVKIVQRKLGLAVDGIYGPNTEAKVKGYQMVHKLVVDGKVGPKTATRMGP